MRIRSWVTQGKPQKQVVAPTVAAPPRPLPRAGRPGLGFRQYDSAQASRLAAGWATSPITADQVVYQSLRSLRARSREQYRNNDFARRFIGMVRTNVVGPRGIGFQARIRDLNGQQDTLANKAIEDVWGDWGRRENCDVEGRLSWVEAQRLFITSVALDGEALIRIHTASSMGKYRFALQFLDPELLQVTYNQDLKNGSRVVMGVELDAYNRPVAYHLTDSRAGVSGYAPYTSRRIRVPADQMIHSFMPEMVGQKRGIPWMATSLMRLRMLEGYIDASLTNARIGAGKMGFYESETPEGYGGTDKDPDGATIQDVEPGTFNWLPRGTKLTNWTPDFPSGEMEAFVKLMLRGASGGMGVSYNALANDLEGVNFSSIRAGVLEEREGWKTIQDWMIVSFILTVYERWLPVQLALGTITVPTKEGVPAPLNPAREDKYRQVSCTPRRWSWVDPLKDVKASQEAVKSGFTSRGAVIRDLGDEPEDVWRETEAEDQLIESMGLEFDKASPTPAQPAQGPVDEGGNDDVKQPEE